MITDRTDFSHATDAANVEPILPNLVIAALAMSSVVCGGVALVRALDVALDLLVR